LKPIAGMLMAVTGITSKTLRGSMTGLLNRPYSMNQASYDLSRLARNGLITRVPGRNRATTSTAPVTSTVSFPADRATRAEGAALQPRTLGRSMNRFRAWPVSILPA
jgi:hypothetical protein